MTVQPITAPPNALTPLSTLLNFKRRKFDPISPADKALIKLIIVRCMQEGWTQSYGCNKANISRMTCLAWRKEDPVFEAAILDAEQTGTDWYEDRLREAAKGKNVRAIEIGLRVRKRIVERHELSGPDGKPIQIEDPKLELERRILAITERRGEGRGSPESPPTDS